MTSDYLYEFPNRGSISGLLRPPGLIYWNQEDLGTGKLQPSSDQLRRSPWLPCFATTARAQLKSRHWALEWHRQHLIFPEGVCHCPVTTLIFYILTFLFVCFVLLKLRFFFFVALELPG